MSTDSNRSNPVVGQIVGTFGLKGAVKVNPLTDFVERFEVGSTLLIDGEPYEVIHLGWHKGQARITFEGIETVEKAELLKWKYLTGRPKEEIELDEDEYFTEDLIGLRVLDPEGKELGVIDDVLPRPGHDLLQIGGSLVPAVKEFVLSVDLKTGTIVIKPIPGLLHDEETELE